MNTYTPQQFQPGHTNISGPTLGQEDKSVLDSPLISLAADVGAVIIGTSLITLKVDDEPLSRAWVILGWGISAIGVIRGLHDLSRIK